jgi:CRISPR/Cas system-associated exonuclease Cas4 (RecB family)
MRTLRASEISTYIFCQRAWWFQRRGFTSQNQAELAAGSELHVRHGQTVLITALIRGLGYGLLLVALMILAYTLVSNLI